MAIFEGYRAGHIPQIIHTSQHTPWDFGEQNMDSVTLPRFSSGQFRQQFLDDLALGVETRDIKASSRRWKLQERWMEIQHIHHRF